MTSSGERQWFAEEESPLLLAAGRAYS